MMLKKLKALNQMLRSLKMIHLDLIKIKVWRPKLILKQIKTNQKVKQEKIQQVITNKIKKEKIMIRVIYLNKLLRILHSLVVDSLRNNHNLTVNYLKVLHPLMIHLHNLATLLLKVINWLHHHQAFLLLSNHLTLMV